MKVVKALNNNMVLARQDDGQELICQGKGIGWRKRAGDVVDEQRIERRFYPDSEDESRHFQQLFSEIEGTYWGIAEQVVNYARSKYQLKVTGKVILPLCDHMAGSVVRYREGVKLENPMLWDVKRVYPKEFQVGKYALKLLKEHYDVDMLEDEGHSSPTTSSWTSWAPPRRLRRTWSRGLRAA